MQDVTVDAHSTMDARLKWLSTEDKEREAAFEIALYESRVRLQEQLREACGCGRSREKKRQLVSRWRQELPKWESDGLIQMMRDKKALDIVMGWKLIDPRH